MAEAKALLVEMADQVEGGGLNNKQILGSMRPCGLQDERSLVLSGYSVSNPSICVPISLFSPFSSIPLSEILASLLF